MLHRLYRWYLRAFRQECYFGCIKDGVRYGDCNECHSLQPVCD